MYIHRREGLTWSAKSSNKSSSSTLNPGTRELAPDASPPCSTRISVPRSSISLSLSLSLSLCCSVSFYISLSLSLSLSLSVTLILVFVDASSKSGLLGGTKALRCGSKGPFCSNYIPFYGQCLIPKHIEACLIWMSHVSFRRVMSHLQDNA